jgi:hypothetical protein
VRTHDTHTHTLTTCLVGEGEEVGFALAPSGAIALVALAEGKDALERAALGGAQGGVVVDELDPPPQGVDAVLASPGVDVETRQVGETTA